MQELFAVFQAIKEFVIANIYLFLFLGALFEGLNTLVLAGFLASFQHVALSAVLPLLLVGHVINGYMWYFIGLKGGDWALQRWGKNGRVKDTVGKISGYFEKHSGKAIIFSKFTLGFEIATLTLAGSIKYNLKRFSQYNLLGSVGWVTVTVFVGYFFGQSFRYFFAAVKNISLAILFLAVAISIIYIFASFLKKHYRHYLFMRERVQKWGVKFADRFDRIFDNF